MYIHQCINIGIFNSYNWKPHEVELVYPFWTNLRYHFKVNRSTVEVIRPHSGVKCNTAEEWKIVWSSNLVAVLTQLIALCDDLKIFKGQQCSRSRGHCVCFCPGLYIQEQMDAKNCTTCTLSPMAHVSCSTSSAAIVPCNVKCLLFQNIKMDIVQDKKGQLPLTNPATLAKSLHGLRISSGVVSCIASLPIDSVPMVSY